MEYVERTPGTLTSGQTFDAIMDAMGTFRVLAMRYMAEEGLANYVGDMEHWYPLQPWLNVLKKVGQKVGPATLINIGKEIIDTKELPSSIQGMDGAFEFINQLFHHNHRTSDNEQYYNFSKPEIPMKKGLGAYTYKKIDEKSGIIICDTPFPEEFDQGLIMTTSAHFQPLAEVTHLDDKDCKKKGDNNCTFLVKW